MVKRTAFVFLGATIVSFGVSAAERTVGPSGDFRSIQAAVTASGPGDIITVRAGTYAEAVTFRNSGVAGKPIVLRAYPGERPIIKAPSGRFPLLIEPSNWREKTEIGWIHVRGFEIVGNDTAAVLELTNAHHIEIRNNYLRDGSGSGILGSGHDVLIDGNDIARCGDPAHIYNHGMYLTGRRFTITNNIIRDNSSYGIHAAAYNCGGICPNAEYSGVVDWLVANNVVAFEKNRSGIVVWQPGGSYGAKANGMVSRIRILNNVFFDNNLANRGSINGVQFWTVRTVDLKTIHIGNNVFYSSIGNKDLGTKSTDSGYGADESVLSANVHVNPDFVGASSRDFHLRSSSPAIGKGLNLYAVGLTKDFDGRGRPSSGAFDVGAYQMTAAPPASKPDAPSELIVR